MKLHKPLSIPLTDVEKNTSTVSDSGGVLIDGQPMVVKLSESWSDLVRAPDETASPDAKIRPASSLPLIDDMKGILQWE